MSLTSLRKSLNLPEPTNGQSSSAPGELVEARCIDCRNWIETRIKTYLCQKLIPVSGTPYQWHWCACYRGPQISKEIYVWEYFMTRVSRETIIYRPCPVCRSFRVSPRVEGTRGPRAKSVPRETKSTTRQLSGQQLNIGHARTKKMEHLGTTCCK